MDILTIILIGLLVYFLVGLKRLIQHKDISDVCDYKKGNLILKNKERYKKLSGISQMMQSSIFIVMIVSSKFSQTLFIIMMVVMAMTIIPFGIYIHYLARKCFET